MVLKTSVTWHLGQTLGNKAIAAHCLDPPPGTVCLSDSECLSFLTSVSWHVTLGAQCTITTHVHAHLQKQYTCSYSCTQRNTSPHVSARTAHCRHLHMSVTVCFVPAFPPQTSKQLPGMSDCMTADKRAINISFLLANLCSSHARHLLLELMFCDTDRFSCQNVCTCVCTLPSLFLISWSSEVVRSLSLRAVC